jgi:hypothetical protein
MYRIVKADKDSYITNKKIYSSRMGLSSSTDANVGQAGTIDLFKLYNEGGNTGIELSRGLIHFDLSPIRELTGSLINIADPSFKCYVSLKDVYGGQTVPSNFSLTLYPLAKNFVEGRGNDVIGYRDLDAVNWFTASIDGGAITTWLSGGADSSGSSEQLNRDYYNLLSSPSGYVPLGFSQTFSRGDENLFIDVTTAISATLAGIIPDYGFRLSYSGSQETDTVTRFVKRFSSRQSRNTNRHPSLIVKYNDVFNDNQSAAYFDYQNKIGLYYFPNGTGTNFLSSSVSISGSGSLKLELVASQSVYVTTSSYSPSHRAIISYLSASWNYFSQSFTGSQIAFGGINQSGSYYADVNISFTAPRLSGVLNPTDPSTVKFSSAWKSMDGSVLFSGGPSIFMSSLNGSNTGVPQRNYAVNITNLKDSFINNDVTKLRVFAYDFDPTLTSFYLPYDTKSKIFNNMHWSVIDPYTKEIIIPFDESDNGTRLSSDGQGMYFTLYMQDLPINRPLEIRLLVKEYNSSYLIENQGFIFKVLTA